ncbi:Homocysteine-binding domain superfamily protein [Abortiporus biennis]
MITEFCSCISYSMGFQSFTRKPSSSSNMSPVLLLDGGFGTTLEDLFHLDISTSLWSAKPIDTNPQVIIDTHLAFMKSGSDIVLSSTYQCSFETFERAGYSREEAIRLMRKSIHLVDQARQEYFASFTSTTKEKKRDIKIALSLGPLGAMLVPTQEFIGVYPPPYGPCAFSEEGRGDNKQNFENEEDEEKAVEALANWNEERLRVFLDDEETWKKVDCLAFETVPLTREIRGIRRAIGRLFGSSSTSSSSDLRKPWWISTVHPNGKFPEKGGGMKNVVEALLGDEDGSPKPDGVGINCTSMAYVPKLVERLTEETMKVPSLEDWP